MGWRGKYYYQNVRIGKRVVTQYIGAGPMGAMAAQLDQAEQAQRAARRAEREAIAAQASPPHAMRQYFDQVRQIVAQVLEANGYHQHKHQWRKQRMGKQTTPAPLGPISRETWAEQTISAVMTRSATDAQRDEYRRLLGIIPSFATKNGDLARIALRELCTSRYAGQPVVEEAISHIAAQLRRDLAGPHPSPIELLLVDVVLLNWHDWYSFELMYSKNAADGVSLDACEQYERIKDRKQQRYERAIETLARVRRLLKLPAPQFNINMPGGQQVNVNKE